MKTTTPLPQARPGEPRSDVGLFAAADTAQVMANLRQDLLAYGVTIEGLLRKYASRVRDDNRQAAAEKTIRNLVDNNLDPSDVRRVIEVLYFSGYQRLLAKHHIRFPAYNVLDEYFTNATYPWGPVVLPRPQVMGRSWRLFGRKIGFPIGVPASVLTDNARWIQHFANNGFNVLTYRTVRTTPHEPFESPNWAFVPDQRDPFAITDKNHAVRADAWDWVDPGSREVTTTNSFGVPASQPTEWMADVRNALTALADDQMLIVSVLGEDYESLRSDTPARPEILAADFAAAAHLAEEAGATIIEMNLSCPNSIEQGKVRQPLCVDVDTTVSIVKAVRDQVHPTTQLVAKLSYLDESQLAALIPQIVHMVEGVAGINTLQCSVTRSDGKDLFPGRSRAGVSGVAIREYAKDFVARLARLRAECGRYFEILGMGGVTDQASFQALYDLGASAVQTASGAFANPFLAAECVADLGGMLPETPDIVDPELVSALKSSILKAARTHSALSRFEIAANLPLRPTQTYHLLEDLEREGALQTVHNEQGHPFLVAYSE